MQENLVIVESPAKAKKIEEYLGKDYKVMSSYGHIRDLKKRELSINEQTMEPDYEIPEEKKKLVTELKSAAKKAKKIWLASDEDREGEAISWHLCEVLGLDEEKTNRIVFHEITKPACTDGDRCSLVFAHFARKFEELDSLVECDGLNALVGRQLCEERLFLIFGRSNLCHRSETSYLDEYRASALWVDSQ